MRVIYLGRTTTIQCISLQTAAPQAKQASAPLSDGSICQIWITARYEEILKSAAAARWDK